MTRLLDAWMAPGLRRLLGLRVWAALRSAGRRLKTPSGWGVPVVLLAFAGMVLVTRLDGELSQLVDLDLFERIGPAVLAFAWLAILILRGGGEQLGFTPSEADQLFAAPVSGAQLIRYKLTMLGVTWLVTGLMLGPLFSLYVRHPLAGLLMAWTLFPGLQLSSMIVALALDRRSRPGARWVLLAVVFGLWGLSAGAMPDESLGLVPTLEAVVSHPVGRVVLFPFAAATTLLTTTEPARLAGATATLLAVDAGLVAVVLALGQGPWLERAATGAARRAAFVRSYRSGGLAATGGLWRVAVPRLPFLGGVGPIAWRRLAELARRPLALAGMAAPVLVACVVGVATIAVGQPDIAVGFVLGSLLWSLFLVPSTLRIDFRSDLDRMDVLLSLPLSPVALMLGQILPVVVLFGVASAVVAGGAAAVWTERWPVCVAVAAFAPSAALFTVTVENLLFLVLPVRMETGEAALASAGRNLVTVLGAYLVDGIGVGLALAAGFGSWTLSGSPLVGFAAATLVIDVGAFVVLLLAARRLRRFDPSRDVPA